MAVRMATMWFHVGEATETAGWCDEHALPHVVTFPIHGLWEFGVSPNFASVSRCLTEED